MENIKYKNNLDDFKLWYEECHKKLLPKILKCIKYEDYYILFTFGKIGSEGMFSVTLYEYDKVDELFIRSIITSKILSPCKSSESFYLRHTALEHLSRLKLAISIEKDRNKWRNIAKKNGWYKEPFYLDIKISKNNKLIETNSYIELKRDMITIVDGGENE